VGDADEQFLRELASLCRSRGTLLIFDEIFTGFRHPHGSVQRATGVYPDLACFGKALSSGLPLSALVGRRDVLSHVREIFYHPTFKGEAYSFAAAAAALRFYVETDVPTVVATFGTKLMQGVDDVSERVGVDGGMVGLPYRMVYRFREPDACRRALMRTLLQQELLKGGVMTFRGFLLPSIAHGDSELGRTLSAYEAALRRVAEACDSAYLEPSLEIPTIV
jgi:glutamate-1-semialdehyde aminotransferase